MRNPHFSIIVFNMWTPCVLKRANGLRYLRWGIGAIRFGCRKKLDSGDNAGDAAESPASSARFVSPLFADQQPSL